MCYWKTNEVSYWLNWSNWNMSNSTLKLVIKFLNNIWYYRVYNCKGWFTEPGMAAVSKKWYYHSRVIILWDALAKIIEFRNIKWRITDAKSTWWEDVKVVALIDGGIKEQNSAKWKSFWNLQKKWTIFSVLLSLKFIKIYMKINSKILENKIIL